MLSPTDPTVIAQKVRLAEQARHRSGLSLGLGTVTMGLMAGLFFSFSVAVMRGLADADSRTFVDTLQRINKAIGNPLFGFAFVGAFVFSATSAVIHHRMGAKDAARWIALAVALYAVTLAITFGASIPLNRLLDEAGPVDLIRDIDALRIRFEGPWNRWNAARTIATTLAFGCMANAARLHGHWTPNP